MSWGRGIGLGLVAALPALVVACGAATHHPPAGGPAVGGATPLGPLTQVHDEIEQLDAQLQRDRAQLGLDAPTADVVAAAHAMAADAMGTVCVRSTSATCGDVCTLADAICAGAERICELATSLPGDAWAEARCDSGKASCQAAGERCCDC